MTARRYILLQVAFGLVAGALVAWLLCKLGACR